MSHIIDSELCGARFSTPEMREVFSDARRYQRWLDIEAALAQVQAELGIIPKAASQEIVRKARLELLELDNIKASLKETSHSLVPLLKELERICDNDSGQYLHFGATTQDIQDTATMLEMQDAWRIVRRDTIGVAESLTRLAEKHIDTLMPGRSQGQHAIPTTFGYRVAIWLDEVVRQISRIEDLKDRVFVVSMFGGVGTMSSLTRGVETMQRIAERLGLREALVSWHTSRDRIAEFVLVLGNMTSTLGKICNDLYLLARTEYAEVRNLHVPGTIGSSTMPHKRNPEILGQVVLLSRMIKYNTMMALEAMVAEDDRDLRALRADWVYIPETCCYSAAAAKLCKDALETLDVRPDQMKANMELTKDFMLSEKYMMTLANVFGKQSAHRLVYEASMEAHESRRPILEHLMSYPKVQEYFDRIGPDKVQDFSDCVGTAKNLTRKIVEDSQKRLDKLRPRPI